MKEVTQLQQQVRAVTATGPWDRRQQTQDEFCSQLTDELTHLTDCVSGTAVFDREKVRAPLAVIGRATELLAWVLLKREVHAVDTLANQAQFLARTP